MLQEESLRVLLSVAVLSMLQGTLILSDKVLVACGVTSPCGL